MTKMKLFAAAAVLSTVIASPVLAQDSIYRRGPATKEYNYSNRDYRAVMTEPRPRQGEAGARCRRDNAETSPAISMSWLEVN
jgi:hypothetical protein